MTPYYSDDVVTIYHGDCREAWALSGLSVLVTDPPYGIGLGTQDQRRSGHGLGKRGYASYEDTYENFLGCVVPALEWAVSRTDRGAIFSGPRFQEMPKDAILGGIYCPNGSGRHRWGFITFIPVLFYGTAPALHQQVRPNTLYSTATSESNGHPCPKPIKWMRWLVDLTSLPTDTIYDPFMGSGTTLRAAKDLGRRAVGFEIEEAYCEIAAKRMAQEVLAL